MAIIQLSICYRRYLEYLYAAANDQAFDIHHRSVFTWKVFDTLGDEGIWIIPKGNFWNGSHARALWMASIRCYCRWRKLINLKIIILPTILTSIEHACGQCSEFKVQIPHHLQYPPLYICSYVTIQASLFCVSQTGRAARNIILYFTKFLFN